MRHWGITGTNGKTTTTWILAEFLNATQTLKHSNTQTLRKCGYVTTVEVNTGSRRFYTGYTTPPLAQLKEIFAEMEANGCTDCVMEVSSHAIHQHRTGDTVFSGGAFTNLSEDHLDYHKTMAAYFDVKLDFARQIANAAAEKRNPFRFREKDASSYEPALGRRDLPPYVVCLDGGYGQEMFNAVGNLAVNVIPVSIKTNDSTVQPSTFNLQPCSFDLSKLQLAGAYNKSNVLTAAALAEAAGVSHELIQAVIPTLKPRWGRLELVENPNVKAKVYVDFAHTPDGLEKVLTAIREEMGREGVGVRCRCTAEGDFCSAVQLAKERDHHCTPTPNTYTSSPALWVVFGAGGDRDPMKRPLMGAACAKLADRLVVTSDNPRSEDPEKIIDAILEGVNSTGSATQAIKQPKQSNNVHVEPDRRKAIEYALSAAQTGDVVVIAGKGHETTQEVKGVKYPFDDREIVRQFSPCDFQRSVTASPR